MSFPNSDFTTGRAAQKPHRVEGINITLRATSYAPEEHVAPYNEEERPCSLRYSPSVYDTANNNTYSGVAVVNRAAKIKPQDFRDNSNTRNSGASEGRSRTDMNSQMGNSHQQIGSSSSPIPGSLIRPNYSASSPSCPSNARSSREIDWVSMSGQVTPQQPALAQRPMVSTPTVSNAFDPKLQPTIPMTAVQVADLLARGPYATNTNKAYPIGGGLGYLPQLTSSSEMNRTSPSPDSPAVDNSSNPRARPSYTRRRRPPLCAIKTVRTDYKKNILGKDKKLPTIIAPACPYSGPSPVLRQQHPIDICESRVFRGKLDRWSSHPFQAFREIQVGRCNGEDDADMKWLRTQSKEMKQVAEEFFALYVFKYPNEEGMAKVKRYRKQNRRIKQHPVDSMTASEFEEFEALNEDVRQSRGTHSIPRPLLFKEEKTKSESIQDGLNDAKASVPVICSPTPEVPELPNMPEYVIDILKADPVLHFFWTETGFPQHRNLLAESAKAAAWLRLSKPAGMMEKFNAFWQANWNPWGEYMVRAFKEELQHGQAQKDGATKQLEEDPKDVQESQPADVSNGQDEIREQQKVSEPIGPSVAAPKPALQYQASERESQEALSYKDYPMLGFWNEHCPDKCLSVDLLEALGQIKAWLHQDDGLLRKEFIEFSKLVETPNGAMLRREFEEDCLLLNGESYADKAESVREVPRNLDVVASLPRAVTEAGPQQLLDVHGFVEASNQAQSSNGNSVQPADDLDFDFPSDDEELFGEDQEPHLFEDFFEDTVDGGDPSLPTGFRKTSMCTSKKRILSAEETQTRPSKRPRTS